MNIGNKNFVLGEKTYVMGILNVTPDSFSDGGRYISIEKAVAHAKEMVQAGAELIDIGGESTRPGHKEVSLEEEIQRVIPVVKALVKEINVPISVDTYKAQVAELALEAGAAMINDVWGFKKDPFMAKVVARYKVPCCLMHNREKIEYRDVVQDMIEDLKESVQIALEAGISEKNIILDPGIGFAKTYEDNLRVMNELEKLTQLGYPVLLGTSRKSMIGLALDLPVEERVEGTIATTVLGIVKGCDFVRVHDIKENTRACKMTDTILRRKYL